MKSPSGPERAITINALSKMKAADYVRRGQVKYSDHAFNKTSIYKQKSRNHLVDQVERFRIGDNDRKREDDLLDTFCYGIVLALGDNKGF